MAKNTYFFSGSVSEEERGSTLLSDAFTGSYIESQKTIIFQGAERSGAKDQTIDLDDHELVEVELDSLTLLMTFGELKACSLYPVKRDRDSGITRLPTEIAGTRDESRGIVGFAIRVLRVFGINLPARAIHWAAGIVEGFIHNAGPGLYHIAESGTLRKQRMPVGHAGDSPVLLLLHGTASSTDKAFASLLPGKKSSPAQNRAWEKLYQQFEGRVFALEQKTLTQTPVANVLQFLDYWRPEGGPPLVLLSHSRGGIVGDLLSSLLRWENIPPNILAAFGEASTEARQLLRLQSKLGKLVQDKRPYVQRHIRVGTPAAGTTLASDKTHIWLSVMANLAKMIPLAGGLVGALGDLAAAIVKEGLKPGMLPGIEAQKPDSRFIKFAQMLRCEQTDLLAVTGDSQGAMKKVISVIFGDKNDLVVNTSSMLKGARYKTRHQLPIHDNEIIHVSYFSHPALQAVLSEALAGNIAGSGFRRGTARGDDLAVDRGRIDAADPGEAVNLPAMFLLPGLMGSELSVKEAEDERDIWLDGFRLIRGQGTELDITNDQVFASGVLRTGYRDFARFINKERQFHLIPHSYDWRQSVFDSVDALETNIRKRLRVAPAQPIVFVCHSMGGLVIRAWRHRYMETWQRIKQQNGRMIQLGTPNYGSWTIPRILQGRETIMSFLTFVDIKNDETTWLNMVRNFPGLLELCDFDSELDMTLPKNWRALDTKKLPPTATRLKTARANRAILSGDGFAEDKAIIYIAGVSKSTPALQLRDGKPAVSDQRYAGDGRVLWPQKEGEKAVDYYMDAVHGDLLNAGKDYFKAITEIALTGKTLALQTVPPVARDDASAEDAERYSVRKRLMLPPETMIYPGVAEMEAAALGGTVPAVAGEDKSSPDILKLSVTHGNLMYLDCPVLVGHYTGDSIRRAERALDAALQDVLTQRWSLGAEFYAGAVGTHEVALRSEQDADRPGPDGAIVVGLGRMGGLQKGDLITTVRNGVLKYAQIGSEQGKNCANLKLASLLIGSGQEALELLDVLDGIVRGVMLANKILAQNRSAKAPLVRITELEFIEWHLDMAIAARHTLERLRSTLSFKPEISPGINKTDGGHERVHLQDHNGWWDSLEVRMQRPAEDAADYPLATLQFSIIGGRAMGVSDAVQFNPREIDAFLTPLLSSTDYPQGNQVEALFEQLVPAKLKPLAAQRRNLVVNMDPASAYLPWEILVDRKSANTDPVAVAAGMLRRIIPDSAEVTNNNVIHAEGKTALVVGNTPGGSTFANLAGAYDESTQVAELLQEHQWQVTTHIFQNTELLTGQSTAAGIRSDIFVKDCQILHFAAHGVHDSDNPAQSGVVIGYDSVNDEVELFSPHHVRAIRYKPALVFINCCHTGRFEEQNFGFHHLSASLATEFIKSGVHCVIGAGWAVDDAAALAFAREVYSCLLNGDNFGNSVRRARELVYEKHKGTNTWAAFQCYGDPGFVISRQGGGSTADGETSFVHISEMLCQLQNIRSDLAGSKAPGNVGKHEFKLQEVNELLRIAESMQDAGSEQYWIQRGDILTQFAIIYCDLNTEDKAPEFLQLAHQADCSDVALSDLLILANYQARYAERRYAAGPKDKSLHAECLKAVQKTIEKLELYRNVHNSSDVHEKLASAYKLHAMLSREGKQEDRKQTCTELLGKMKAEYELAVSSTTKDVYYPALNAILGYVLLRADTADIADDERLKVDTLKAKADNSLANIKDKNFWSTIAGFDREFIFALENNTFDEAMAEVLAKGIVSTANIYGSAGQLDSIIKQFRCVMLLSNDKKASTAARRAVDIISERFKE